MIIESLLFILALHNPACKADDRELLLWGSAGAGIVQSEPVPKGKVWLVRAAGVFTNDDAPPADYMLELIKPVKSQGGVCCWRIPLVKSPREVNTTPLLALDRPLTMLEGEMLAGRSNGAAKFGINAAYYELPATCLHP